MNERTNTLLYKNIPLTLYSRKGLRKGWCWLCVRGELETGTDCHILTQSSSDHSSTSFSSWLGCSTVGHWGPKPSVCHWLSIRPLVPNWLTQAVCGTWLYNCLTPTCFLWEYASAPNSTTSKVIFWYLRPDAPVSLFSCLFTQVHFGSVEGQYVTPHIVKRTWRCPWCNCYRRRKWTRRHEFKSWTRLIAFHIALIPLGKVWIQLFSLQLWVNSRTD